MKKLFRKWPVSKNQLRPACACTFLSIAWMELYRLSPGYIPRFLLLLPLGLLLRYWAEAEDGKRRQCEEAKRLAKERAGAACVSITINGEALQFTDAETIEWFADIPNPARTRILETIRLQDMMS